LPRDAQPGAHSADHLRCTTSLVTPDVILAMDANSTVYALTDEPLIVFSSNLFAIPGFRAL
jgi:predicted tellurium resistance membrane protein TerC